VSQFFDARLSIWLTAKHPYPIHGIPRSKGLSRFAPGVQFRFRWSLGFDNC
jgi:hypothetical protein